MSLTRDIAADVYLRTKGYSPYNGMVCNMDPMTMIMIMSIIIEVVRLINECQKKDDEAVVIINDLSTVNERQLRRILRRRLGFFRYWLHREKYVQAFKHTGKEIDVNKMAQLRKEAKN